MEKVIEWEARDGVPLFLFTPKTLLEAQPDRFQEPLSFPQEVWEKPWPGQTPSQRHRNKIPKKSSQEKPKESEATSSSGAGSSQTIIQQLVATTYDNRSDVPYVSSSLQSNFSAARSSDRRIPMCAKSGDSCIRPKTRSIYMCEGGDVSSGGPTVSYYPTSRQHDTTPSNTNSLPPHPTTTLPPDREGFSGYPTAKFISTQNQSLQVRRKCGWELKVERELKIVTDYTGIENIVHVFGHFGTKLQTTISVRNQRRCPTLCGGKLQTQGN